MLEEQELFEDKTETNFNENYDDEEQFEALLQQLGRLLDCLNCNIFTRKIMQKWVQIISPKVNNFAILDF